MNVCKTVKYNKTLVFFVNYKNCEEMKNDRIGLSKKSDKKKGGHKETLITGAQRLAEKEYEEYYDRIRQLSRGL